MGDSPSGEGGVEIAKKETKATDGRNVSGMIQSVVESTKRRDSLCYTPLCCWEIELRSNGWSPESRSGTGSTLVPYCINRLPVAVVNWKLHKLIVNHHGC